MRLIDADALKDAIVEWKYHGFYDKLIEVIDNAPSVFDDKAYSDGYTQGTCDCEHSHKIPKGDWICVTKSTFPQYQPDEYKCSNCNKLCHIKYYYCPFCGADMRGDSHG